MSVPSTRRSAAILVASAALAALTAPGLASAAEPLPAAPDLAAAGPMTRAELAEVATDTLAELRGGPATAVAPLRFSDIAGHALADDIAAAAAAGLVRGYPDGSFRPAAPATDRHVTLVTDRLVHVLVEEGLLDPGDPMPEPVLATFGTPSGSFRVVLDDPGAINLVAGAAVGTHVGIPNGRILPGDGGVNTGRGWHLVDVEIVEMAMEVCDGTADYVDEVGLDAWYEQHGDRYCPWGATYLGSEPHVP